MEGVCIRRKVLTVVLPMITHGKFGGKGKMRIKPFHILQKDRSSWMNFLLKNIKVTPSGCWEWQGRIHRHKQHEHRKDYKGYPCGCAPGGKSTKWMHRVSYALYHGPIPKDMHIDHECQNTICVCPWHVQAIPPWKNYQLIHIRKRQKRIEKLEKNGQQRIPF